MQKKLIQKILELNNDDDADRTTLQVPTIPSVYVDEVTTAISANKDID